MLKVLEQLHTEDLLENDKEFLYSLLDDEKLQFISKNMPSFFEYSKQLNNTAYLSWNFKFSHETSNDFNIMADAYYECVIELIEKCIQNNIDRKLDTWIFPILYNIGHSIELKLKAIYLHQKSELVTNHKWIELTEILKEFYVEQNSKNEISPHKKKLNEQFAISLEIVKKFLEEFLSRSGDVTFTRYPIDRNNNDFFYNNSEDNVVADLILLKNEFILSYYLLDFIVEMNMEEISNNDN